jgi:uncharacterized repeat protein (TIGR03803 family)
MRILIVALWACASASILLCGSSAQAGGEKVLYSFCSQANCADGAGPRASVLQVKGKLYVTASQGGDPASQSGTVVALDRKKGAVDAVYSLANYDIQESESPLIHVNGKLYGISADGGAGDGGNGAGTVFSLDPKKGTVKIVYSFCSQQNCTDGALPLAGLLDVNGVFYGTTLVGGGPAGCQGPYPGCGTLFSLDPATGEETVLYSFCQTDFCADGSRPVGALVSLNGLLYGTTSAGGQGNGCSDTGLGCGIVFALDPSTGAETVLHTFAGVADGGVPTAGLIAVNGTLYGTTQFGGSSTFCGDWEGCGTVFSIDPLSGAETLLHIFKDNGKDGQNPYGGLVAVKGKLYGTTVNGGVNGKGTVFSLDLGTGKEKVEYAFCGQPSCADGAQPYAGLVESAGTLYGTTDIGGANNNGGTVFSIKP